MELRRYMPENYVLCDFFLSFIFYENYAEKE